MADSNVYDIGIPGDNYGRLEPVISHWTPPDGDYIFGLGSHNLDNEHPFYRNSIIHVEAVAAPTYALTDGDALSVIINGDTANPKTVVFDSDDFVNIAVATNAEVIAAINASAAVYDSSTDRVLFFAREVGGKIRLYAEREGNNFATIQITTPLAPQPNANLIFLFPIAEQAAVAYSSHYGLAVGDINEVWQVIDLTVANYIRIAAKSLLPTIPPPGTVWKFSIRVAGVEKAYTIMDLAKGRSQVDIAANVSQLSGNQTVIFRLELIEEP